METRSKRPSAIANCKKHPKHQQSPGVCSLCLRQRLSKIPSSSISKTITDISTSSSSSISPQSLVSSSPSTSPMHNYRIESNTYDDEGKGYLYILRKSRSMAFVNEKVVENNVKKKKGNGFWSKLIGLKKSNIQERPVEEGGSSKLMHSRTMREMLTTRL